MRLGMHIPSITTPEWSAAARTHAALPTAPQAADLLDKRNNHGR